MMSSDVRWDHPACLVRTVPQNHRIDDLTTENATPTREHTIRAVEFFDNHDPTASLALHLFLLYEGYVRVSLGAKKLSMEPMITGERYMRLFVR
jgi:hypothetical protein